jgi:carbon starvation protein
VRLNRYLFEELWATLFKDPPRLLKHYWTNSGLAVVLMLVFAFNNSALSLWALFATSNQLLAALVLGVVTFWLVRQGFKFFYTLIPAVAMLGTTVTMLVLELNRFLHMPEKTPPAPIPWDLVGAAVVIIALTAGLVVMSLKGIVEIVRQRRELAQAGR